MAPPGPSRCDVGGPENTGVGKSGIGHDVASIATDPERAVPRVIELLRGPLLLRDPGIATAMIWGMGVLIAALPLLATLAGLAGSLKTLVLGFATLSDAHWSLSGEVVLMTLLGGMGTFAGPVLGAFTIIGLQNFLADRVGSWVTVIIGAIFVICVVAFRRGFVGELLAWRNKRRAAGKG